MVVYTDAMYNPEEAAAGRVGVVIYDPEDQGRRSAEKPALWRFSSAIVPDWVYARMRERTQYVGQLEILAAVLAYTSRPEQFRGRDVIHFIDNSGAEAGLVKGYSRDLDSARLAGIFHCLAAALEANVWFEYVASKANLADLPSRDDFELLRSPEFGAEWFELEWPELAAWDGELSGLFESLRKRSRGRKRARGE